ncbi:glycosyltransferase [Leptolyngbya ohadii]|uniref:glycosyltransferase n=1 Tax=Leptolyngbya ohadii TaxID=1962290 RepID=UPI0021F182F0|nr:glycosyltransferase [Leptolyngbya ohadii]
MKFYCLCAMETVSLPESDLTSLPTVSVIVPIYNGEADLPELIQCLQAQRYPTDRVEYLLVDNGSRDRTSELLQSILHSLSLTQDNIRVRVLSETQIQSSYAARNCGIRATSSEILAFTDADCRPQPDWLLHLVQPFVQKVGQPEIDPEINLEIGVVAGEILPLSGNTLLERYADRHEILSQRHTLSHSFYSYGQTANLAVRRQALEQVGSFRPWLTTGGDADLCWRIQQTGSWQLQYAEQAIVQHRHRSTCRELRHQWMRYGRSNRYLHELYGVTLEQSLTAREVVYRLGRWLVKEIPLVCRQSLSQQNTSRLNASRLQTWIDSMLDTPIGLLCRYWRTVGQQQTKLPEMARHIEPLPVAAPARNL